MDCLPCCLLALNETRVSEGEAEPYELLMPVFGFLLAKEVSVLEEGE